MNLNSGAERFFFEEVCFVCLAKLRVVEPSKTLYCQPTSYRFKLCDKFCLEVYRGFANKAQLVFEAEREVDKMLKDKKKKADKSMLKKISLCIDAGRSFGNIHATMLEFQAFFGLNNAKLVDRDVLFRCLKELHRCMLQTRRFQRAREFLNIIKANFKFGDTDQLWLDLDLVSIDLDIGLAPQALAALTSLVVPRTDVPNMRKSLELKMRTLIALGFNEKALGILKSLQIVLPEWNKYNGSDYEAAELASFAGSVLCVCVQLEQSWEVAAPYVAIVSSLSAKRHCKCDECLCNYSSALHFLIASLIHYEKKYLFSEAVVSYNSVLRDAEDNPNIDVIVKFSYVMGLLNQFIGKYERAVEFFMTAVAEMKHRYICHHYLYSEALSSLQYCMTEVALAQN